MNPDSLYFTKDHIWISSLDEPIVRIGISDYAQQELKSIIFLNLPDTDERIESGERLGDLESLKTVIDMISPVSGTVVKVNEDLIDTPDDINSHPYDSWLLEVKVDSFADGLMNAAEYQKYVEQL